MPSLSSYRKLAGIFALLVLSLASVGTRAIEVASSPEEMGMATWRLDQITQDLQKLVHDDIVPGAAFIVLRGGKYVYHGEVGYSDKETMTGFRTNSICRLLSMSKPVAAVAIMKLIEDGKLAMDDPLSKYLPEWKGGERGREGGREGGREVTTENMYCDFYGFIWEPWPSVTGISPDVWMHDNIFKPLGMVDTAFSVPMSKINRYSTSYSAMSNGRLQFIFRPRLDYVSYGPPNFKSLGGGIVSTAKDFARFGQMLLNGGTLDGVTILSSESVDTMWRNYLPASHLPMDLNGWASDVNTGTSLP
ncbi:beta-lactamase, partial [Nannochloropsis oceanica]